MPGRRARDDKGTEKCEMPKCGNTGTDFEFISWAVNPSTKVKGMILCPQHAAREMRNQSGNA